MSSHQQVILITDGLDGLNVLNLSKRLLNPETNRNEVVPSLPFNFPAKFHIMTVASPEETSLKHSIPVYQKLIDLSGAEGSVFVPEGGLTAKVFRFQTPQLLI